MSQTILPACLCCLLLTCCTVSVNAQWSGGLSLGANTSYYQIDQIPNNFGEATSGGLFGYQAAVWLEYAVDSRWSLRSGVHFQSKQINWGLDPYWIASADRVYRMQYLGLPLTLQFMPTQRWYLKLGPQLGYLLNTPGEDESWERWDFLLRLGAGFELGPRMAVEFEHLVGLPRVGEGQFVDDETQIEGLYAFRNRSMMVSVLYFFERSVK